MVIEILKSCLVNILIQRIAYGFTIWGLFKNEKSR
jgi:hypothetical protein